MKETIKKAGTIAPAAAVSDGAKTILNPPLTAAEALGAGDRILGAICSPEKESCKL